MVFAGSVRGAGCQVRRLLLPSRRLRARPLSRVVAGYQWFAAKAHALGRLYTRRFILAFRALSVLESLAGCIRSLSRGIGSSRPQSGIAIASSRLIRNGDMNSPSGFPAPCLRTLSAPMPWCRRLRRNHISIGRQARSPSIWNLISRRKSPLRIRFHLLPAASLSTRPTGRFRPRQGWHWTRTVR